MNNRVSYWSESKKKYIPLDEMHTTHPRNAIRKMPSRNEAAMFDELMSRLNEVVCTDNKSGDVILTIRGQS